MSTNKLSHLKLQDDNGNDLPQEVQERVNNFIDKLPTIPWFKPSKDLKKSDVDKQINFTLECFGVKASIEYKTLKSEEDWDSAWDSAMASAWYSAWDSAIASAWDSARASDWSSAWDSARASARASALDSARDSARASDWSSASDSARASQEALLEDNEQFKKAYPNGAFKQLFKLWEMGLYPVGILEETGKFTVYVPEIDLDTWLNEEEQIANDGMPKQGDMIEARYKTELGMTKEEMLSAIYDEMADKTLSDGCIIHAGGHKSMIGDAKYYGDCGFIPEHISVG